MWFSRRSFLCLLPAAALTPTGDVAAPQAPPAPGPPPMPASFPAHDPNLVRDMVGVSHGNVDRVRELLAGKPALANAAWDWGYGDWESALGAASHVGNREIAGMLLAAGARPSIFSAAMLGHVEVVK